MMYHAPVGNVAGLKPGYCICSRKEETRQSTEGILKGLCWLADRRVDWMQKWAHRHWLRAIQCVPRVTVWQQVQQSIRFCEEQLPPPIEERVRPRDLDILDLLFRRSALRDYTTARARGKAQGREPHSNELLGFQKSSLARGGDELVLPSVCRNWNR